MRDAILITGPTASGKSALAVRLAAEHPLSDAYAAAEEIWAPVYRSKDAQEGPAAFREKRRPVWQGR